MSAPAVQRLDFLDRVPRRADGATLAAIYVVTLLIIPARLVFRVLPLALSPASVVAILIGFTWLCAQFTTTLGAAKGRMGVRTALFVYIVTVIATYGYATYGYLPVDELSLGDHAVVLMLATAAMALGLCDGVRGADRLDFVLKTVVVCGAFVAVVGILQFMVDFDLTKYLKLPGLRFTTESVAADERSGLRRVQGTAGHPIEFGVVMAMLLPLAAHFGFQAKERGEERAWRWWVCAGLMGAGIMFSVSRSAILGLLGTTVVLFIGWPAKRRVRALGVAAGFLVIMKLAVPGLLGTFYNLFSNIGNDDSVKYRTHDYAAASDEIAKHVWLGRGYGTWYAPKHEVFDNQYILSTVEGGVIGVAALVLIFAAGLYAAIRARYLSKDVSQRDLGLTIAASLIAPLIGSATFDLASFSTATGLSFLFVGAAGSLLRNASGVRSQRHNEPS
jgi:O-antigen ligase